jgi:hypothetical protein
MMQILYSVGGGLYIVKVRDDLYAHVNVELQRAVCSRWIEEFLRFSYDPDPYEETEEGETARLLAMFTPWIETGLKDPHYLKSLKD